MIGKRNDSIEQFYENKIVEKSSAVIAFSMDGTGEMIMTAIFVPFRRKRKSSKRKEAEGQRNMAENTGRQSGFN